MCRKKCCAILIFIQFSERLLGLLKIKDTAIQTASLRIAWQTKTVAQPNYSSCRKKTEYRPTVWL